MLFKTTRSIQLCLLFAFSCTFALELPEFSMALDLPLLGTSIGVGIYGSYRLSETSSRSLLDKSKLLVWDRPFAGTYSYAADVASDVLNVQILSPVVLLTYAYTKDELDCKKYFGTLSMYAEALAFQSGLNLMVRSYQWWPRPYLYNAKYKDKNIKGEAYGSFYSGHVSAAFTAAVFLSYEFNALYPNSPYFWPVTLGGFGAASMESVLRIASGKHYPTDAIAGAFVGSMVSISVIFAHEFFGNHFQIVGTPNYAGIILSF